MNVRLEGIGKAFGGVPALDDVRLEVRSGQVAGLVGENGAGKSTLMNILGGAITPDAGAMWLDDTPYRPTTPADARRAGIAFVHQELTLFPNLTVTENICLLDLPRRYGLPWIDRRAAAARAHAALDRVGLRLSPDTLVERLSPGERQLVEIARALLAKARVLILDEPTTSLGASDRARLRALIAALRGQGLAQIFISHDLDDVLRTCDEVTVLRDGRLAGGGAAAGFTLDALVRLMVGRDVSPRDDSSRAGERRARASDAQGTPALEVRRLSEPGILHDVTLSVARGEIVGIFGLMGAGRSELARRIFGLEPYASGQVLIDGRIVSGGPRRRIRRGLALVTEDRRFDGLCLRASVADNLALASLTTLSRGRAGTLDRGRLRSAVSAVRETVGVTARVSDASEVGTLSGGNQQKVVLGKWLMTSPRVLILDEPTRGIDVGARTAIHQRLRDLAADGAGLLVISSDLEELLALADRLLVMRYGAISGEFPLPPTAPLREAALQAALPEAVAR